MYLLSRKRSRLLLFKPLSFEVALGSEHIDGRSHPKVLGSNYCYLDGFLEYFGQGQWLDRGRGFIGFRWNSGAGFQYGWARITKTTWEDKIRLEDYAYADPGEPITAGQRSSNEMVPDIGSLGGLALGATRGSWHGHK